MISVGAQVASVVFCHPGESFGRRCFGVFNRIIGTLASNKLLEEIESFLKGGALVTDDFEGVVALFGTLENHVRLWLAAGALLLLIGLDGDSGDLPFVSFFELPAGLEQVVDEVETLEVRRDGVFLVDTVGNGDEVRAIGFVRKANLEGSLSAPVAKFGVRRSLSSGPGSEGVNKLQVDVIRREQVGNAHGDKTRGQFETAKDLCILCELSLVDDAHVDKEYKCGKRTNERKVADK